MMLFSKAKWQIELASNCNKTLNVKQQCNKDMVLTLIASFKCPRTNEKCQNAGPVSQTEEGVAISKTLSNHRA